MEKIFSQFSPNQDTVALRNQQPFPPLQMCPSLDVYTAYLHEEMRQSYLAGLDHAAIVAACALLEYTLKGAVYSRLHLQANREFDQAKWDEVESKDFTEIMNWAKTLGVLSKKGHRGFERFRMAIRNYYMHGATPDQVKKAKWPVTAANWKTGEVRECEIELGKDLSLQRMCRLVFDRTQCDPVVRFADQAVRELLEVKDAEIASWEKTHAPEKPTREQFDAILEKLKEKGFEKCMGITRDLPEELPVSNANAALERSDDHGTR